VAISTFFRRTGLGVQKELAETRRLLKVLYETNRKNETYSDISQAETL